MTASASDTVIVGAGPSGSFTALSLARLGIRSDIFEEHSEIGVPSHCSGHLSIKGLRLLGLHPLPKRIVENVFYGAVFHPPNGKSLHVRFQLPVTCSVNRTLFDRYIADAAARAGAVLFTNSTVESLVIRRGVVAGVIVRSGRSRRKILTKLVVDSEGVSQRILRQTSLPPLNPQMLMKAVQAEVDRVNDVEMDMVEIFVGSDYAPGFYAWLIPRDDGTAKIGLASRTGNPRNFLERLMKKHPVASRKLGRARIERTSFHSITLGGPISKSFCNGMLVTGDAASQVKPTTGGGVIFGMTCARVASEVACKAIRMDDASSNLLSSYQDRCERLWGTEVALMLRLRRMMNAASDDLIDNVTNFCVRVRLDKALRNFGDIDFLGRSFLWNLKRPRVSLSILHLLLSYLLANK